jgi:hypothetical protein
MSEQGFELEAGGLRITGYPSAERAIRLTGHEARRLSDLALHTQDLHFAGECLIHLRLAKDLPDLVREALWRSSIVHYMKCFGKSASRFSLDHRKFLDSGLPRQVHRYFHELRDKHVVHDDNSYLQSIPVAIVSPLGQSPKIQDVVSLTVIAHTLTDADLGNLDMLIGAASRWVDSEFERLQSMIRHATESLDHAELLIREQASFRVSTIEDLSARRSPPTAESNTGYG